MYADDITQIISHPSPQNQFIKLATDRAIGTINKFEETNKNKFLIIPAAKTNPGNLNLQNINVDYVKTGKL